MVENLENLIEEESRGIFSSLKNYLGQGLKSLSKGAVITTLGLGMYTASNFTPSFINKANAANFSFAWDKNTEPDLKWYSIHYKIAPTGGPPYNGTGAVEGNSPIQILLTDLADQENPTYTIHGLPDGVKVFFVSTAGDIYDNESGFSTELSDPPSGPTDQVPPVIYNSQSGGFVSGTGLTVSGNVTDNVGVDSLEVLINGNVYPLTLGGTPQDRTYTTGLLNLGEGVYDVEIRATDASGNPDVVMYNQTNIENVPVILTNDISGDLSDNGFNIKVPFDGVGITNAYLDIQGTTIDFNIDGSELNLDTQEMIQLFDLVKEDGLVDFEIHLINGLGEDVVESGTMVYDSAHWIPKADDIVIDDMRHFTLRDKVVVDEMNNINYWRRPDRFSEPIPIMSSVDNDLIDGHSLNLGFIPGSGILNPYVYENLSNLDLSDKKFITFPANSDAEKGVGMMLRFRNGSSYEPTLPFELSNLQKQVILNIEDLNRDQLEVLRLYLKGSEEYAYNVNIGKIEACNLTLNNKWINPSRFSENIDSKISFSNGNPNLEIHYITSTGTIPYVYRNLPVPEDWSDTDFVVIETEADDKAKMYFRFRDGLDYSPLIPFVVDEDHRYVKLFLGDIPAEKRDQVDRIRLYCVGSEGYEYVAKIGAILRTNNTAGLNWQKIDDLNGNSVWNPNSRIDSVSYDLNEGILDKSLEIGYLANQPNAYVYRNFNSVDWSDSKYLSIWNKLSGSLNTALRLQNNSTYSPKIPFVHGNSVYSVINVENYPRDTINRVRLHVEDAQANGSGYFNELFGIGLEGRGTPIFSTKEKAAIVLKFNNQ